MTGLYERRVVTPSSYENTNNVKTKKNKVSENQKRREREADAFIFEQSYKDK